MQFILIFVLFYCASFNLIANERNNGVFLTYLEEKDYYTLKNKDYTFSQIHLKNISDEYYMVLFDGIRSAEFIVFSKKNNAIVLKGYKFGGIGRVFRNNKNFISFYKNTFFISDDTVIENSNKEINIIKDDSKVIGFDNIYALPTIHKNKISSFEPSSDTFKYFRYFSTIGKKTYSEYKNIDFVKKSIMNLGNDFKEKELSHLITNNFYHLNNWGLSADNLRQSFSINTDYLGETEETKNGFILFNNFNNERTAIFKKDQCSGYATLDKEALLIDDKLIVSTKTKENGKIFNKVCIDENILLLKRENKNSIKLGFFDTHSDKLYYLLLENQKVFIFSSSI